MNKGIFLIFLTAIVLVISCYSRKVSPVDSRDARSELRPDGDSSLIVPASESISKMVVEEGFEVQLVASEPLVSTPVAMNFDNKGRIWAVEMDAYMTDAGGTEENRPSGKIVILSDKNGDGLMDSRQVFLDSLILPRAICLIEDGILVAEPPRLWFVEIKNDKPGKKTLVDEAYTQGGNVEAQSNALFRAIDNWIYSGGSDKRYRKSGNKWLTERTHLRGQWGITQDDFGRLYYNNNSQNLLGDYFPPGLGAGNLNLTRVSGFNERLISDNRVYPVGPTPGVNRGYRNNVLDSNQRLVSFTAACGPALYRGDIFSEEYYNNVFVAEPAANLIKRNVLVSDGFTTQGRQAYQGREFLASHDERFRPVSLYNGPDGALYVVDMYRGIIQHKLFLTDYLKKQISERFLERPVSCGRIYRVIPKGRKSDAVKVSGNLETLMSLLKHPNGWVRDKAQHTIIDRKDAAAAPGLRQILKKKGEVIPRIHALWTLEGLGLLNTGDIIFLLENTDKKLLVQALAAMPSVVNQSNYSQIMPALRMLATSADEFIAPHLAFQLGCIKPFNADFVNDLLVRLARKYPQNSFVADAVISNLNGQEEVFYRTDLSKADTGLLVYSRLNRVIHDIKSNETNRDANLLRKEFPRGANLFRSTCQPCHGADGNGIASLAPPLNKSEWVTGDKRKLIAILLHGLTGPITVNSQIYQTPEISGDMPGIGSNTDIVDEDIAQLSSYIRRSWSNDAEPVSREQVIKIRKMLEGRQKPFTEAELKSWN